MPRPMMMKATMRRKARSGSRRSSRSPTSVPIIPAARGEVDRQPGSVDEKPDRGRRGDERLSR